MAEVNVYSIATGPVAQRLSLMDGTNVVGTIECDVTFEQLCVMTLSFCDASFMFDLDYLTTLPKGGTYELTLALVSGTDILAADTVPFGPGMSELRPVRSTCFILKLIFSICISRCDEL